MASVTSSAAAIPLSAGLKLASASTSRISATAPAKVPATPVPRLAVRASLKDVGAVVVACRQGFTKRCWCCRRCYLAVRASLKDVGAVVVATAASTMLAGNAMALEVLLAANDGGLIFKPNSFSVPSGEKIVFKNNAGFPHNVVFDEDEVPAGVDASEISMSEEDLLNGPGETYSVTLTEKVVMVSTVHLIRELAWSAR